MNHPRSLLPWTLLFSALFAISPKAMASEKPLTDRYGDPLPRGAIARFGTERWRYPAFVEMVQFVSHGKRLITCCGNGILHIIDAKTGEEIRRFGRKHSYLETVSPDKQTVAQVDPYGKALLWSIRTGEKILSFDTTFKDKVRGLRFTGQDEMIAWSGLRDLKVWSTKTGTFSRSLMKSTRAAQHPKLGRKSKLLQLAISPQGKELACTVSHWSSTDKTALVMLSLAQGKVQCARTFEEEQESKGLQHACPEFSPSGQHLAWPESNGRVALYKTTNLKKLWSIALPNHQGRIRSLSFSRDGKKLAALTRDETIQILDSKTGRPMQKIGNPIHKLQSNGEQYGRQIREDAAWNRHSLGEHIVGLRRFEWSPDSRSIAQGWGHHGAIRIWNIETGKSHSVGIGHFGKVQELLVSPNGKALTSLAEDQTVRTWDTATATQQRKRALPPSTGSAKLLSPQRALTQSYKGELAVWDIQNQKWLIQVKQKIAPSHNAQFDLLQNSRFLLVGAQNGILSGVVGDPGIYDLQTGAEITELTKKWTGKGSSSQERLASLIYTSRGDRAVATISVMHRVSRSRRVSRYLIRCRRPTDQEPVWETKATEAYGWQQAMAFTPDDRAILTFDFQDIPQALLLESWTGKERSSFVLPQSVHLPSNGFIYAFSRCGNLLALYAGNEIFIYNIRHGRVIARLASYQNTICAMTFGAAPSVLFTGCANGTILQWDLHPHIQKSHRSIKLTAIALERAWKQLADPVTTNAYNVGSTLISTKEQAVDLLSRKLQPVAKVPIPTMHKLIDDLNGNRFIQRKNAYEKLLDLGPQSMPFLKKRLQQKPSLELRRRAEQLFEELRQRDRAPNHDLLRSFRAIEVLEAIGSAKAKQKLKSLAQGAPEAEQTKQARAALKRRSQQP